VLEKKGRAAKSAKSKRMLSLDFEASGESVYTTATPIAFESVDPDGNIEATNHTNMRPFSFKRVQKVHRICIQPHPEDER
jgi:hypothetical protein